MSICNSCKTKFVFGDVLKGFNPAKIKCSGCEGYIQSSYMVLGFAVIVFTALSVAFWFSPFSNQKLTGMPMLVFLASLGLIFEYGYFLLLDKGLIVSNLDTTPKP